MNRESEFLRRIPRKFPALGLGVGDDAALLPEGLLATVDTLVEGRHFIMEQVSCSDLAKKLLGVNLSDIAAMGGRGAYALLSLTCGEGFDADQFMKELLQECDRYQIYLVGGDTVSAKETVLSLTLLGHPGKILARRNAAAVGDIVFVSGALGGAVSSGRHLKPQPRLDESAFLVEQGLCCLMDLSDGLAQGLYCVSEESSVKLCVKEAMIPLHQDTVVQDFLERIQSALYEGEDFELLGTIAADKWEVVSRGPFDFHEIGVVEAGEGVLVIADTGKTTRLKKGGYEHQW